MSRPRLSGVALIAPLIVSMPWPAEPTESCRFRVAAIRVEIAARPDRSQLEDELATADRLCKRGEIGRAAAILSEIVAELRDQS